MLSILSNNAHHNSLLSPTLSKDVKYRIAGNVFVFLNSNSAGY